MTQSVAQNIAPRHFSYSTNETCLIRYNVPGGGGSDRHGPLRDEFVSKILNVSHKKIDEFIKIFAEGQARKKQLLVIEITISINH